jgi:hypothetical protein
MVEALVVNLGVFHPIKPAAFHDKEQGATVHCLHT